MKQLRILLVLVLLLGPALFAWLIWLPSQRRMQAIQARIDEAQTFLRELPRYDPLSAEEAAILESPGAPWKTRIPLIRGDRDRLLHYHRVVTELDRALSGAGLRTLGMRSSWDPIRASFTLGGALAPAAVPGGQAEPLDGALGAWVVEVQLDGPTGGLFTALGRLREVQPLLEPVGLRWESTPERRAQSLLLRSLVTQPAVPVAR